MLDSLTPVQRTALFAGIPLVGAVVLYQSARGGGAAPAEDDGAPEAASFVTPPTDALGVGEVSDMVSGFTDLWLDLTARLGDLENRPTTTPPATAKYPRAFKNGTVRAGETANTIAIRLRNAGERTYTGAALTGAYLMAQNRGRTGWDSGTATSRRWTGSTFRY